MRFWIRVAWAVGVAVWLGGVGAWAQESAASIRMAEIVEFSEGASGEVGLMSPKGGALRGIEGSCGLQRRLPAAIAAEAEKLGISLALSSSVEPDAARVLVIRIEGAVGNLGGAMSGTKSLTLRGELREGDVVVGSFVAREQRTALVASTCEALEQCADKLARHIAHWLVNPVKRARLGSA